MRIKVDDKKREITVIDPSLNGKSTKRLEPRIFELFQMLVSRKDQVVTREEIIRSIWDDYPSAQELLNQSISILRKRIGDTDQHNRIIQTIPKKGYVLNSADLVVEPFQYEERGYLWTDRKFVLWGILLLLLVVFFLFH